MRQKNIHNLSHDEHYMINANSSKSELGGYYFYDRTEVLEMIPISARRLLDVGCGGGGLSHNLKKRQPIEVHGVELVTEAANHAQEHLDKVWNMTIEAALPEIPENYYDCIVAADVLEHLSDPWAVLSSLKSKLAPHGKIIASIPNIQNWGTLSELIQGKWDYLSEGILDRTHLRFFTRKSVEELFWNSGLHIRNIGTTKRGPVVPNNFILKNSISNKSLEQDGQTWQFLVEADIPAKENKPWISVIILNYNGIEDTIECLKSVKYVLH
jgi:2-polyprenyl-3-methyl-5-hydroxy-6-metoxy-1,4-benzoquinol methylase